MSKVPSGYVFQPSDEVLVLQYLLPKVTGKPLPSPCIVTEFDLYGNMPPDQIWGQFKGISLDNNDLYFFTNLKKKNERISRTIDAGGTWSNEGSDLVYTTNNKLPIGTKRRFHYDNPGSPQHGCWVMHEYSLDVKGSKPSSDPTNSSHVLCRLRKKSNFRKRKLPEQLQSQTQQVHDSQIDSVVPSIHHLNQPHYPARKSEFLCNRAETRDTSLGSSTFLKFL